MPNIYFKNQVILCTSGDNLRRVLRKAGVSPHNGNAEWLNCKGMGTCGTCAVRITGEVSPMTAVERWRLDFPPHRLADGLRLACQCSVVGDLKLEKQAGFWGESLR
jgi:ferredoxin